MISTLFFCFIFLCLGLVLRLPHVTGPWLSLEQKHATTLNTRTMHGDEAVNTVKFQKLYFPKDGKASEFVYDPEEYHGPSLYYLTVPFAKVLGHDNFAGSDEGLYRGVTLFFGLAMIPLCFLLRKEIGLLGCIVIAGLTIVSPGLTYYSRYYIHETLLVSFTFSAIVFGFKWLGSRGRIGGLWAACTGVSLAMMHATKETCVIAFAGMAAAGICVWLMKLSDGDDETEERDNVNCYRKKEVGLFLFFGMLTWLLFFSSFFTNMQGLTDSFMTYFHYLDKADAGDTGHVQGFWFYHEILWGSSYGKMYWSEKSLLIGAVIGFILAFLPCGLSVNGKRFSRFIAIYSLVITLFYCLISYKTTWSMLSFLHSYVLLCGVAAVSVMHLILKVIKKTEDDCKTEKGYCLVVVIFSLVVLGCVFYPALDLYETSAKTISKRLESHPKNPYVLGQPRGDVKKLAKRADALSELLSKNEQLIVYVNLSPTQYSQLPWPLPWYLRKHLTVFGPIVLGDEKYPEPHMYVTGHDVKRTISDAVSEKHIIENYGI